MGGLRKYHTVHRKHYSLPPLKSALSKHVAPSRQIFSCIIISQIKNKQSYVTLNDFLTFLLPLSVKFKSFMTSDSLSSSTVLDLSPGRNAQ